MHKYNGESLTTYQPRGPWTKIHTDLAALGSTHISNVHILANLEPFRWSSPSFVQKAVTAMHDVHHANACISIRRLVTGIGLIRQINCLADSGRNSWTATGCGTRHGEDMPGTAVAM